MYMYYTKQVSGLYNIMCISIQLGTHIICTHSVINKTVLAYLVQQAHLSNTVDTAVYICIQWKLSIEDLNLNPHHRGFPYLKPFHTLQKYTKWRNGVYMIGIPSIQRIVIEKFHCSKCNVVKVWP